MIINIWTVRKTSGVEGGYVIPVFRTVPMMAFVCEKDCWIAATLVPPFGPTPFIVQRPTSSIWSAMASHRRSITRSHPFGICLFTRSGPMQANLSSARASSMCSPTRNQEWAFCPYLWYQTRRDEIGLANLVYNIRRFLNLKRVNAT